MDIRYLYLPLAVALAANIGCTSTTPPATPATPGSSAPVSTPGTTTQHIEDIKQDAKALNQELDEYTFNQKTEYAARMKTQLDEVQAELDQMNAKIEAANEATRAEYRPKVQALRDQLAKLHLQLDKARESDASTWNDVKKGMRSGYQDLKDGVKTSRQWLSEKIAP